MLNLPETPKWDIARVSHSTLVNADCFDVFPFIDDKSVDAIIADLPYGTTACKWDSVLPLDKLWSEYKRILKPNGVVVLTASQPFASVLGCSNLEWLKYEWIWDKVRGVGFQVAKHRPMMQHENILVFGKGKVTYNPIMTKRDKVKKSKCYTSSDSNPLKYNDGIEREYNEKYPTSILTYSNASQKGKQHPTQKNLDLFEYLIKTYTNENEIVLDNTMGSGTTNLACLKLNRKSIGIEKEKQYYDVAVRRLSLHYEQSSALQIESHHRI
jgi:site-specific DNA-methyltransferase (adenine-specific)